MVAPTQATLTYTITKSPSSDLAQLATAVAAVVLPTNELEPVGVSLTSDITTTPGLTVVRTLIFSLLPIVRPFDFNLVPAPIVGTRYSGSIVSSSPQDSALGTGLRTASIRYKSGLTLSTLKDKEILVTLNGTTPVNLENPGDIYTIDTISPLVVGSFGGAFGLVNIYTELNGRAGIVNGQIANDFQGSIISTSSVDNATGVGAQLLRVTYMDSIGGGPFIENIVPNGQTPVNFVNVNHYSISNIEVITAGDVGSNLGTISILSGLNATGGPIARLEPSFFAYFPQTTDLNAPFEQFFRHILASKLSTKVDFAVVIS